MELLLLFVGLVVGFAAAWGILSQRGKGVADRVRAESAVAVATAEARAAAAAAERAKVEDRASDLEQRASAAQVEAAGLRANLEQQARLLQEQAAFVEKSKRDLEAVMEAAAVKALNRNSEHIVAITGERADRATAEAKADLDARKTAIETLLRPVKEGLDKLEAKTGDLEKAREGAYGRLDEQIRALATATERTHTETSSLATALKGTQARGWWGEVALENLVEWAGLVEHCEFEKQKAAPDGSRPDLVVRLPGDRRVAIDSKAVGADYLVALRATDEEERRRAMDAHVAAVRGEMKALAARDYDRVLGGGVGLVVMFLPADSLLGAALLHDPRLQEDAARLHVVLASPSTLLVLLKTLAIFHQQAAVERDARHIHEVARDLYERGAKFAEHLGKVGKGLADALKAYNAAVGSFEGRLLPMARRLEDLKVPAQPSAQYDGPRQVEEAPRLLDTTPAS